MNEPKMVNARGGPLLGADGKFNFSCHEGLACFKKCCRDISIFLTPLDVLRMKNKLNISSGQFLDQYTIPFTAGYPGFPLVLIRMLEEENLRCPFITDKGCGVYMERPWSCRMAPVEIRGEGVYGFCFDQSHCHGLKEHKEQTVQEWMKDQGLGVYEGIEAIFNDIPTRMKPSGQKELDRQMMNAFHLAAYDLDRFRQFIFETPFLEVYEVPMEVAEKVKTDDVELLQFGFSWLMSAFTNIEGLKKAERLLKDFA